MPLNGPFIHDVITFFSISALPHKNGNFICGLPLLAYQCLSHGKVNNVIWLYWGYRFWFLLIFFILHVHEIWPFMPNSSVFIFLMLRALYRMIPKNPKLFFGENSLNVTNVKLLSNFFFNVFGCFLMLYCFQSLI